MLDNADARSRAPRDLLTTLPGRGAGAMTTVPDLRTVELQDLLRVAERVLDTAVVCADQAVVKRRSVGAPTSRATWVRVSVCALAAAAGPSGSTRRKTNG